MQETEKIWMNGELVAWADAKVHVLSHALHYGSGVFEGIRAYATDRGPAVFRLMDHLRRLERSSEVYFMQLPYGIEELRAGHARGDRGQRPRDLLRPAAGVPRATASWASTRSTARSRSSSPCGRGAPTSARRRSSTACA